MLEPPNLPVAAILSAVQRGYDLAVTDAAFLPIGNDASAWAYRLRTAARAGYFLKVRRGFSNVRGQMPSPLTGSLGAEAEQLRHGGVRGVW